MKKYIKLSLTWAVSIITFVFMFLPEDLFKTVKMLPNALDEVNIIVNRIVFFLAVLVMTCIVIGLFYLMRNRVRIIGRDYVIEVIYGDIFKQKKCKKIIPFDECFTAIVGNAPADINPASICGQYLRTNSSIDIESLLSQSDLTPKGKSKFAGKDRYESGRILLNDEFLLMAFVKLDKEGRGLMTYSEYIDALTVLWEEIDKYYGQKDVCIPVLGSGTTRFKDITLTKQELLDTIIASYKLTRFKIHKPNKLIITCRREDISLNKIGTYI